MNKSVLLLVSFLCINLAAFSQPVNFSWAKSMGGKGADGSVGVAKDAAGNLYVTGEFIGTRTFGTFTLTSDGYSDVFLAKYSTNGTCLWVVKGGYAFSNAYGGKVAVNGNDVFVTGNFTNTLGFNGLYAYSNGAKDIFVAGFDATNGTCNWITNAGSAYQDDALGIDASAGGGFYLCGNFNGSATFGTITVSSTSGTDADMFIAKYTATGTCIWVNAIGGTGQEQATAVKELPSGDILATGAFEGSVLFGPGTTLTSTGFTDIFIAKFNSSGVFSWAISGGCPSNSDIGYDLSFDPAGNIYATGFIGDTATFGSVVINNAGGVNVLVAKFTSTGVCLWGNTGGATVDDIGYEIETDFGGSSYVAGYINGDCYFGNTQITGVNYVDIFIVKYDNAGILRWIARVGGADVDKGKSLVLDVNGYCYMAGDYAGNAVFGSTGLIAPPGITGVFLTRVGGGSVGVNEIENTSFSMYPNPARDYVQLDLQQITDEAFTISLYTLDGKLAFTKLLSRTNAIQGYQLDIQSLAAGNYILKLESSLGDFSSGLVVQ